ncbi:MAG TPA: DNA adenine methylase [Candidatus Saccharimonadales bacterium]|nr:DNA adenine methylase [Candidatus Saccharimonadales bacterium]
MNSNPLRLQPFPYQGSKRVLAPVIFKYVKRDYQSIIEPFAGSSAVVVYAAYNKLGDKFWINDNYEPLILLWKRIVDDPEGLAAEYEHLWLAQQDDPVGFYYQIRAAFNASPSSETLLFLLAKCAKNAVRFNSHGEFNQSPDKRRLGRRPNEMRKQLLTTSMLLKDKTKISSRDYNQVFDEATSKDLVYLDPPYQGTSNGSNPRYSMGLSREKLIESLESLRRRNVPFILSYDGSLGDKSYGDPLPASLGLHHKQVVVGRSAQATLNGRVEHTTESIYLSPELL